MIANAGISVHGVLHESQLVPTLLDDAMLTMPCSVHRGLRPIAFREPQGNVLLLQVCRNTAHQAGQRWAHPGRSVDREQERWATISRLRGKELSLFFSGFAEMTAYSATKFAIRGMTQCAAMDYGKYGITVNAYAPGVIETPLSGWSLLCDHQAAVLTCVAVAVEYLDEHHTSTTGQPKGS